MCLTKYIFISGLINKKPGENTLQTTSDNFKQCVDGFKKLKYNEPTDDVNQIKNNYIKLIKADGTSTENVNDISIDVMKESIDRFIKISGMSPEYFEYATVDDIKKSISS
jgi:hypothetical protein